MDRARVYLAVCERQKNAVRPTLVEPEDLYYAAVLEKNRGNVSEAIEHLKHAAKKNGGGRVDFLLACCYAQSGDPGTALEHLKKAIEEDQRHRVLARHDRDFDPVRDSPEFQDLLASQSAPGAAPFLYFGGEQSPRRWERKTSRQPATGAAVGHPDRGAGGGAFEVVPARDSASGRGADASRDDARAR